MNKSSLTTLAMLAFAAPAFAQAPQDHQQHHPGVTSPSPHTQGAPAPPATPPSTPPEQPHAQSQMPTGQIPGTRGIVPGQGQSGSGMITGGQSGMMMNCPMMQGMRGMMAAQGMAAGTGTGGTMPMMAGRGHMMKVMFAVADTNCDGALSFDEITAIHKRIFDGVAANTDGKVSVEELQRFMRD
jgi:hypothetical protein